jgi:hypothetical protein
MACAAIPAFAFYWTKVQGHESQSRFQPLSPGMGPRSNIGAFQISLEEFGGTCAGKTRMPRNSAANFICGSRGSHAVTLDKEEKMARTLLRLVIVGSLFLTSKVPPAPAQVPDGTVKITSRMVAPGIGLSWGEGVLIYKGRDYPFTFKASGLFRDVDTNIAATELSGQVFNLKNPEDFTGNYQKAETDASGSGGGTRATMKNQNGVVVNLMSTIEGRKFSLAREGMDIELKKQKP